MSSFEQHELEAIAPKDEADVFMLTGKAVAVLARAGRLALTEGHDPQRHWTMQLARAELVATLPGRLEGLQAKGIAVSELSKGVADYYAREAREAIALEDPPLLGAIGVASGAGPDEPNVFILFAERLQRASANH